MREIWADDPEPKRHSEYEQERLIPMLQTVYQQMITGMNMSKNEAIRRLKITEPFKYHINLIDELEL